MWNTKKQSKKKRGKNFIDIGVRTLQAKTRATVSEKGVFLRGFTLKYFQAKVLSVVHFISLI